MSIFHPKFFTCLKDYSLKQFYKDITAGIIVAIIALPLSIALAIASGVSPEKGLHTAIIAGFITSLLGGSRVQIGGLLVPSWLSYLEFCLNMEWMD